MGRDWSTAQDRELGYELRKRREAAGLTGVELARQMGTTPTKISRMELGMRATDYLEVITYLAFLKILPAAEHLVAMARRPDRNIGYWVNPDRERRPDALRSLIYHESTATSAIWYDPRVINGLLQTIDYARAIMSRETWRSPEEIEAGVWIRMGRKQILHRPNPARFTFFVHEDALRRPVVDAAAMHEQLLNIVLLAALDHVTVRVVPANAEFGGQFGLLRFEKHDPLVYLPNPSSALFLEDPDYVEPFRQLAVDIDAVALDGGQSREAIAGMASEYDRGSTRGVDLEEEQLQRGS